MIKKIRKWYNGIKMLRFLEEDIPDTTLEHLIKEINKKQLPARSLISSCYEKILKISTVIRTKNHRAALESQGVRNEFKADRNKITLMYYHMI